MTTMTTMMMMMMVVMMSSSAFVARAENPLAPRLRDERIVLQTTLGDLTLALYDDAVAPATAAACWRSSTRRVADLNHFFRVDRGFVAQIAECASGRRVAMNDEQRALATKTIPGEFSKTLRHGGTPVDGEVDRRG